LCTVTCLPEIRNPTAGEQTRHICDSQGQNMSLAFRQPFKLFPIHSEADPEPQPSSSSLLLLSLELSDTKVYEPQIRAFLGTASHFCEVVNPNPQQAMQVNEAARRKKEDASFFSGVKDVCSPTLRCRANLEQISQPRPGCGLDLSHFQYERLEN